MTVRGGGKKDIVSYPYRIEYMEQGSRVNEMSYSSRSKGKLTVNVPAILIG